MILLEDSMHFYFPTRANKSHYEPEMYAVIFFPLWHADHLMDTVIKNNTMCAISA